MWIFNGIHPFSISCSHQCVVVGKENYQREFHLALPVFDWHFTEDRILSAYCLLTFLPLTLNRFSDRCATKSRLLKRTVTHSVNVLVPDVERHQQTVGKWNFILLHRSPYSALMWRGLKLMITLLVRLRKPLPVFRRIINSCINFQYIRTKLVSYCLQIQQSRNWISTHLTSWNCLLNSEAAKSAKSLGTLAAHWRLFV